MKFVVQKAWAATHKLGTKFYEVVLIRPTNDIGDSITGKCMVVRRYGKVLSKDGGGQAKVTIHEDYKAALDEFNAAVRRKDGEYVLGIQDKAYSTILGSAVPSAVNTKKFDLHVSSTEARDYFKSFGDGIAPLRPEDLKAPMPARPRGAAIVQIQGWGEF